MGMGTRAAEGQGPQETGVFDAITGVQLLQGKSQVYRAEVDVGICSDLRSGGFLGVVKTWAGQGWSGFCFLSKEQWEVIARL